MLCQQCSEEGDGNFCAKCGDSKTISSNSVGFTQASNNIWTKIFTYRGRASRSEYWYGVLSLILEAFVLGVIIGLTEIYSLIIIIWVLYLISILTMMSLTCRRLHDTNHSGWWQLLSLTGIGGIVILIFTFIAGDKGINKYDSKN